MLFFFSFVAPAHFSRLAFADVFEGKIGTSKSFMDRLVQKLCVDHKVFQRGKILKHKIEMIGKDDYLVLMVMSRTSSTSFSTFLGVAFCKLLESLLLPNISPISVLQGERI